MPNGPAGADRGAAGSLGRAFKYLDARKASSVSKARREAAAEARAKTTTPAANIRAPLNRRAQDRE